MLSTSLFLLMSVQATHLEAECIEASQVEKMQDEIEIDMKGQVGKELRFKVSGTGDGDGESEVLYEFKDGSVFLTYDLYKNLNLKTAHFEETEAGSFILLK